MCRMVQNANEGQIPWYHMCAEWFKMPVSEIRVFFLILKTTCTACFGGEVEAFDQMEMNEG